MAWSDEAAQCIQERFGFEPTYGWPGDDFLSASARAVIASKYDGDYANFEAAVQARVDATAPVETCQSPSRWSNCDYLYE